MGAVSRCQYDENFTTKFYTEKIFDITGYHADDFVDNKKISFASIIHHEDAGMVKDHIDESVRNRKPYYVEFRIIHRNGDEVWVSESGRPVYDTEGNLVYLDGITTEITEKKLAEQALIDAKRELEQLNEKLEKTVEERTKS
jgi:PAS domain S-box-containing protein